MATDVVKQIRRRTRRKFSADEKIRIVLEGLPSCFPHDEAHLPRGVSFKVNKSLPFCLISTDRMARTD